jgi:hypothetical protein
MTTITLPNIGRSGINTRFIKFLPSTRVSLSFSLQHAQEQTNKESRTVMIFRQFFREYSTFVVAQLWIFTK